MARNMQNPIQQPVHGGDYVWETGDMSVFEGAEKVEDAFDNEGNYIGSMIYWAGEDGGEGSVEWVEADDISEEVGEV